ncbi:PKD domain-containing protein [bacterium]|nr:PKD domain-containing protein [bacterium]MCI0602417.1 PKD domain-containing protein [bacterium]
MKFRISILILFVIGISGCGDDDAVVRNILATITGVSPAQVSIGQQGEGTISGNNFGGASAVSLGDQISVDSFSVVGANQITVRFTVAGNAAPGPRTVSVTTVAGTATAGALTVINNRAPLAQFSVFPPAGSRATEFEMDGSGSRDSDGDVKQFRWEFGDGQSANGKKVKHKFANLGTFNVQLTVTDNDQATASAGRNIDVLDNAPPVAVIKVTPNGEGGTTTNFEFDGSESFDPEGRKIDSYLWDFGDGDRKKGEKATHQFGKKGEYTVTLTVTDNKGISGANERLIKVDKISETKCAGSGRQGKNGNPDIIIKILEVGPGRNVVFETQGTAEGCGKLYYKCGDIRQGGITIPNEVWYGTICEMYDRHDGTYRVRLGGGNGPVVKTAPQIYLHAATCNPFYFNLYCN